MSLCIFTEAAFLKPIPVHGTRFFPALATQRPIGKVLCRKAQGPLSLPRRKRGRFNVMNMDTDDTDESFEELACDIREYLKTCPESESSPLAYITLRNAGRLDLISRIMSAGGYTKVSKTLGVRVDESMFIPSPRTSASSNEPSPDTADDYKTSLAVGRDLEERLDTIEEVMKNNGDRVGFGRKTTNVPVADNVPTGEELRLQNATIQPKIIDEPMPVDERFTLTLGMRIGMLCLAIVSAIGLGRSSNGVISDDVVSVCHSLTYGLLFAHLVLGVYAGAIIAPQKRRNAFLWFTKVSLGGPLAARYLRGLGTLPD